MRLHTARGLLRVSGATPKSIFSTIILLFGLTIPVLSQTDQGRISGTIKDEAGAVLPGATLTITNERTGDTRTVSSNRDGHFLVTNLRPSLYSISAAAPGFNKTTRSGLELVVGQALDLNIELRSPPGE